jgi:phenylacetyl-CoA:acceptor oxidoreductase subunit 2
MYVPNSGRVAPWQQTYWDWRAAGNFIFGGTGAGTLIYAAAVPGATPILGPAGAVLVLCGLLCVWFEIGRPWRALNVFRRPGTSWMSREALLAPWLLAAGGLEISPWFAWTRIAAAALALAYLYSQARILNAGRAIPAWRHPRAVPLIIETGFAEGAGIGVLVGCLSAPAFAAQSWLGWLLAALVLLRVTAVAWYRAGLRRDGAPQSLLRDLSRYAPRLFALDACAIIAALAHAAWPRNAVSIEAAAVLAVAAGWWWKHAIVVRLSYNQGFALPMTPVRGAGVAGPGARPGW